MSRDFGASLANSLGIEPSWPALTEPCNHQICEESVGSFGCSWFALRLEPKARFELALVGYGPTVLPLHHLGEHEWGTSPFMRLAASSLAPGERVERPYPLSERGGFPLAEPEMLRGSLIGEVFPESNRHRAHSPGLPSM